MNELMAQNYPMNSGSGGSNDHQKELGYLTDLQQSQMADNGLPSDACLQAYLNSADPLGSLGGEQPNDIAMQISIASRRGDGNFPSSNNSNDASYLPQPNNMMLAAGAGMIQPWHDWEECEGNAIHGSGNINATKSPNALLLQSLLDQQQQLQHQMQMQALLQQKTQSENLLNATPAMLSTRADRMYEYLSQEGEGNGNTDEVASSFNNVPFDTGYSQEGEDRSMVASFVPSIVGRNVDNFGSSGLSSDSATNLNSISMMMMPQMTNSSNLLSGNYVGQLSRVQHSRRGSNSGIFDQNSARWNGFVSAGLSQEGQKTSQEQQAIQTTHSHAKEGSGAVTNAMGAWSAASAALLSDLALTTHEKANKYRKKPKDKPKRPLSAYNIFFKEERQRILEEIPDSSTMASSLSSVSSGSQSSRRVGKRKPHGKIGFQSLAKIVGKRWQNLPADQMKLYKDKANNDLTRYRGEMEAYARNKNVLMGDDSLSDESN